METVVDVEGNHEAKADKAAASDAGSDLTLLNPDPVVYKLVRVDGDGRLVPATDDEVLVVEDLLKDDRNEVHFAADNQPIDTTKRSSLETENDKCSGGKPGNLDVDSTVLNIHGDPNMEKREAKRKRKPTKRYIEEISDGGSKEYTGRLFSSVKSFEAVNLEKISSFQEVSPRSDGVNTSQSRIVEGCSSSQGGSVGNGSSTSAGDVCKPNFSLLKGEICLDNLSVKELQETFKATFGRETSVKDKQWLNRRIAMGLTNSCNFSTTTFIIEDNKVVKMVKGETSKNSAISEDLVTEASNQSVGGPSDVCDKQINVHSDIDAERPGSSLPQSDSVSEDPNMEQKVVKRVRKPTKRYIEEISEGESRECSGKMISSVRSSEIGKQSADALVRPFQHSQQDDRPIVTHNDSFGGSGVQVSYVSRGRRSRPRENFMTLTKLQPCGLGTASKVLKKTFEGPVEGADDDTGNNISKARLSPKWIEQPLIAPSGEGKHYPERIMELEKVLESKSMDSFEDKSDDNNTVTMPSHMGGMRRKHHRPWSLTEVVKLVEGVARYGAGRWSEIKRLAFASYSYRTSVDLKDKWRNLLRASLTQLPAEKGMQNFRKHGSIPIPAPILLRVKELAEMQSQVPPNLSSSKFSGHSVDTNRSVQEARSGYL